MNINKIFKVAVIGCGSISPMHLEAIEALENTNLVAVCDNKPDICRRTAEKYGVKGYTDHIEMFKKEKLDAVHICLPHYLHTAVAIDAFNYGINVLSEKPMSINYEDAENAVNIAAEKGLQYGIIFQCRYNTPSQFLKERLNSGKLGKVLSGRVVLTWYRPDDYYGSSDWKGTWDKEGGGVIIDQAIHSIDMANWFIGGKPVEVQSTLHNRNHKNMMVEDSAEGLIKYEDGTLLAFYAMNNYKTDDDIEIRLFCEKGSVRLSYGDVLIMYNDGTREYEVNKPQEIVSYTGGKSYWGTQHAVQIDRFYRALRGILPLELSAEEVLSTQKIICDIYKNDDMKLKPV